MPKQWGFPHPIVPGPGRTRPCCHPVCGIECSLSTRTEPPPCPHRQVRPGSAPRTGRQAGPAHPAPKCAESPVGHRASFPTSAGCDSTCRPRSAPGWNRPGDSSPDRGRYRGLLHTSRGRRYIPGPKTTGPLAWGSRKDRRRAGFRDWDSTDGAHRSHTRPLPKARPRKSPSLEDRETGRILAGSKISISSLKSPAISPDCWASPSPPDSFPADPMVNPLPHSAGVQQPACHTKNPIRQRNIRGS